MQITKENRKLNPEYCFQRVIKINHDHINFIPKIQGEFTIGKYINVIHNINRLKEIL